MAIVFLDTEFTDLRSPQLLSIGLVSLDDWQEEFYVELNLKSALGKQRLNASSNFVRDIVLPQWGRVHGAIRSNIEMGRSAGEWLLRLAKQGGVKVGVVFDFSADFVLLEAVIRDAGIWDQVKDVLLPMYIDPLTSKIDGEFALENFFRAVFASRGLAPHHALADAMALREAYKAMAAHATIQGDQKA